MSHISVSRPAIGDDAGDSIVAAGVQEMKDRSLSRKKG